MGRGSGRRDRAQADTDREAQAIGHVEILVWAGPVGPTVSHGGEASQG